MATQEHNEGHLFKILYPTASPPDSDQNRALEAYISSIIAHTNITDLYLRFFGIPDKDAVSGRITGRIPQEYERPREIVVVAFENGEPVGYGEIIPNGVKDGEFAMLVASDKNKHGIGKGLFQHTIREALTQGKSGVHSYVDPENRRIIRSLRKWGQETLDVDIKIDCDKRYGPIRYSFNLLKRP